MIIWSIIILFVLSFVFAMLACGDYEHEIVHGSISAVLCILGIVVFIFRMFSWIYKSSKDRRCASRCYNCC